MDWSEFQLSSAFIQHINNLTTVSTQESTKWPRSKHPKSSKLQNGIHFIRVIFGRLWKMMPIAIHAFKQVKVMLWRWAFAVKIWVRFFDLFGVDAGSFSELSWYDGVCNLTSSFYGRLDFWPLEYLVRGKDEDFEYLDPRSF